MRLEITPKGVVRERLPLAQHLEILRYRLAVTLRLVWFEVKAKQFGRILGQLWLIVDPLLFAGLYLFLVIVIAGLNPNAGENLGTFLFILVAVTSWRWISRTIDNSPMIISGYGAILKQTNFPLGILMGVSMGVEFFNFLISFVVMIIVVWLYGTPPDWHLVWVPLLIVVQATLIVSLSIVAAIVGTFIKDLGGILYVFTSIWWYVSPGMYSADRLPEEWRFIYNLNPLAHLFPAWRAVIMEHENPKLLGLGCIFVGFGILLVLGLIALRRTRHLFFRVT